MDRRTKQLLTIAICLLIFFIGIYYDITQANVSHQSIFEIFGF